MTNENRTIGDILRLSVNDRDNNNRTDQGDDVNDVLLFKTVESLFSHQIISRFPFVETMDEIPERTVVTLCRFAIVTAPILVREVRETLGRKDRVDQRVTRTG